MQKMPILAVASNNQMKIDAATDAILGLSQHGYREACYIDVRGTTVGDCPDCPPQPIGLPQTRTGALFRAKAALATDQDATYGLGIENGILCITDDDDFTGLDVPVVALICRKTPDKVIYASGAGVQVEGHFVRASLATNQQKTCGKFIAEVQGFDHDNWHKGYAGVDRKTLISGAIFLAFTFHFKGQ